MVVALGGCGGPIAPIDVGSKDVSVDLLLGAKVKRVAQAPVPPLVMPAPAGSDGPGIAAARSSTPTPTEVTPLPACPHVDPLRVPRLIAGNRVARPPKQGEFTYRTTGKLVTGGANHNEVVLDPQSTVTVRPSPPDATGTFTFDMVVANAKAETTTTTYRVITKEVGTTVPTSIPPQLPRPSANTAGIYLAGVTTSGGGRPFSPGFPGIEVAKLPLDVGTKFDAAGTDGVTTMSWHSTMTEKRNVDACGTPLDSYVVDLTDGMVTGADGETVHFSSTFSIGSQYGGIPLRMATVSEGSSDPNAPVSRSVDMTINREPETS
jgi:hypothetical protein